MDFFMAVFCWNEKIILISILNYFCVVSPDTEFMAPG